MVDDSSSKSSSELFLDVLIKIQVILSGIYTFIGLIDRYSFCKS